MKNNACFRVSVDEVGEDFAKYAELAKTRTFEIYDDGKVEVMLVRISAIPNWNSQLQKSLRTELMTPEEWEMFATPPEDLRHLPDSYDDWEDSS